MTLSPSRHVALAVLLAASASAFRPFVSHSPAPLAWRRVADGVETTTFTVHPDGVPWSEHVIVARITPARATLHLQVARRDDGRGRWSVDSAPATATLAFNAGQFSDAAPWGWLVRDGVELQPPGSGPLAGALVAARNGALTLVPAESLAAVRASGEVETAVQSYPMLLDETGAPLPALQSPGHGVDLEHRDARLAVGIDSAGRLVVAITRFGPVDGLPLGPTVPEMAEIMRGLGCRRAMLLDGGISSQLVLRDHGDVQRWRAYRRVPVGLIVLSIRQSAK